jgi:adenylate kinase family enzyme
VGNSGSGKTTTAAALARNLGVPHIELDAIFHQPGWTPLELEAFRSRVSENVSASTWVVDGNYSTVNELVWERADTVVWLDLSRSVVAGRVVARTLRRVVLRTELWNGNREPVSNLFSLRPEKSIIVWSLSRHSLYRRRFADAAADPRWSHLSFIRLQTRKQVDAFLRNVSTSPIDKGAT